MTDESKPDLQAVMEHYGVQFRGTRQTQMVACPFNHERKPSCSVNLAKQLFKCHSCGEGGDVYSLIMKMEGLDFGGARAFAAALGLPAGDAGAGDGDLRGSAYAGRRRVGRGSIAKGKGRKQGGGGYVPSWRRQ